MSVIAQILATDTSAIEFVHNCQVRLFQN